MTDDKRYHWEQNTDQLEMWQRIANDRSAEIVRLRDALDKYGQHHGECRQLRVQSNWRCTCGLDAALTLPAPGADSHEE